MDNIQPLAGEVLENELADKILVNKEQQQRCVKFLALKVSIG